MIILNKEKCIGCGDCVIICPVGAIILKENKACVDNSICVSCKACISDCPQNALSFSNKEVFTNSCVISKRE